MTGTQQLLLGSGGRGEGAPQNQSGGVNVTFKSDGTCTAFTPATPVNWYTIAPQPGVGDFFWIKLTDTGLSSGTAGALTGPSISGFTNLSAGGPQASIPAGIGGRNYSYQISSSSSGAPVVASGTGNINNSV